MDKYQQIMPAANWFVIYNPGKDDIDFVPLVAWALVSGGSEVVGLVCGTTKVHRCDLTDIPWEYWYNDPQRWLDDDEDDDEEAEEADQTYLDASPADIAEAKARIQAHRDEDFKGGPPREEDQE